MKILVVEDNENSRVLQENILEATGHEVTSAENGRIALKMIQQAPPDLVITDLLMPELDGYGLCRELKQDPKTRHIPIIVYTATYTDPEDEKLALAMGADRFIVKPAEVPDLLKVVEQVLEKTAFTENASQKPAKQSVDDFETDHSRVLIKKLSKKAHDLEQEHARLIASETRYRVLADELGKAKQSLQKAQEIAHLGNWEWEIDSDRMWWSDEIYRIFGMRPGEVSPSHNIFIDLVHPDDRNAVIDALKQVIRDKGAYRIDHRIVLPDQTQKNVTQQGEVHHDTGGKTCHMTGIVQDITEQKRMEEEKLRLEAKLRQAQKMEAIGTLAGGIAHDFNNILTPIIGYAELLSQELPLQSPSFGHAEKIIGAAYRARELVGQILTFSRETEYERKPIKVGMIIKETLKLLRSTIPSTIEIQHTIDKRCGAVLADPTQIHQIIMNLCTNAYQAMRETGGVLSVSLSHINLEVNAQDIAFGMKPGRYNYLVIGDTGCGVECSILERIFDPYFTTKEKGEGTGLGLAVVHGIVKNSDGHITVKSEPGVGTRIHIYLPEVEIESIPVPGEEAVELVTGRGEFIMLVDDERDILQLEKEFLQKFGYSVQTFSNGSAALAFFQNNPDAVDLLVTDMTMPKMTGTDLAEKMLSIRSDLPIVLCSGFTDTIDQGKATALGISRLLNKPMMMNEFARAIRDVLDSRIR